MKGRELGKLDASVSTAGSRRGRSKDLPPIATTWTALDRVETGLQEVVTTALLSLSLLLPHPPNGGLGPILRDLVAPPSKLGVVVLNAFRPNVNSMMRYGPAIFALKSGLPMFALIHEKDVIISINGFHSPGAHPNDDGYCQQEKEDRCPELSLLRRGAYHGPWTCTLPLSELVSGDNFVR